jgi:hypothetical protein
MRIKIALGACVLVATLAAGTEAEARRRSEPEMHGPHATIGAGVDVVGFRPYNEGERTAGLRLLGGAGWVVTPRLIALGELSWTYTDQAPYELRQGAVGVGARLHYTRWLWAQAQLGVSWITVKQHRTDFNVVDTGLGPAAEAALGVDLSRGENFSFAAELRGSWSRHDHDGDMTKFTFLLTLSTFSWL